MISRILLAVVLASSVSPSQAQRLSPAQWEQNFKRFDTDGDGKVTVSEAEKAGRNSGWIGQADQDGDKATSWEEVVAFLRSRMERPVDDPTAEPVVINGEIPKGTRLTREGIEAAAAYSAEQNGHSFLVAVDGRIVYERYDRGWAPELGHRLASGTKSFSGVLLAAAVQDELLTVDEPVAKTITEWQEDERLAEITYRDLLSLTSGIEPGENGRVPAYSEAAAVKSLSARGAKFRYGPNAFQVFGEALRRKLAARDDLAFEDPLAYLEARVLEPIGLSYTEWRRDRDGMPHLPSGAFLSAREWSRFGLFLLEEGKWEGEPLVDTGTLAACLVGTEANPGYGLTFWLLEGTGRRKPGWAEGAYMAAGAGKQRLFVIPAYHAVVVRQGESRRFENEVFLDKLFPEAE